MSSENKDMTTVEVELGNRSYNIMIGKDLLSNLGQHIANIAPRARCAVVSDTNVHAIYGHEVSQALAAAELTHTNIIIDPGERSKSMQTYAQVLESLLDARLERNDVLIALGGGVVGDLSGFAAATMRRGMKFVQVPTSLLAQVDSSVGGKTGINSKQGKNLIGSFYQPSLVVADIGVLQTLNSREFAAGYAEVAKYGLINRPDFFSWLEKNHNDVFSFGEGLRNAVAISCQSKATIVATDEQEAGQRALLNLGHTFGHALEGFCEYDTDRLVHGEAVSIGICLAFEFSNRLNLCSVEDLDRVKAHFKTVNLPTSIKEIPGTSPTAEALQMFIAQDKKVSRGALTFILANGIGKAHVAHDVPASELLSFLEEKTR